MAFPRNFLTDIAREKELAPGEKDVFLALLGDDKSRPQIAEMLHVSVSAVKNRLTGIYSKFQIGCRGPVKESRLKDYLSNRYQRWESENSEDSSTIASEQPSIDALVREVRSHCCKAILDNYSKIRLPDNTRIDVDRLYVDVYVLKKLSSQRYALKSRMLEGVKQREDDERLTLGQQQKPPLGQQIVRDFPQLMVFGKLGSGKTIFLQHLAVDCSKGRFFCDHIPVLIKLDSIQEGNPFNLLNLIHREFGLAEQEQTQKILNQGKAFILLDGLDEVPGQLRQSVRDQIYEFAKEYRQNRFVLTCRTQTTEYIADNFQPIEVADFNPEQVKIFARNWFTAIPETSSQAEKFIKNFVGKIEKDKQIRELAVTPILLSLMCLLFTAEQDLPNKRSELYEQGINLLLRQWNKLKKWNKSRYISRDYQQLSISDKKKMLSYLAFRKFEQPDNFILFDQDEIEGYIAEYLRIEAEKSEAILRGIEAHHGLLIQRAQGFWSFSHLTFQEYFIARKIEMSCNPYADDDPTLQALTNHVTEKHWREVFLLTVEMLPSADALLRLMKKRIDALVAADQILQQFLIWLSDKSCSVNVTYKPVAIRFFYLSLSLDIHYPTGLFDEFGWVPLVPPPMRDLDHNFDKVIDPDLALDFIFKLAHDLDQRYHTALAEFAVSKYTDSIYYALLREFKPEVKTAIEPLKQQLCYPLKENKFMEWWQANGQAWTEELREVLVQYHKFHDLNFNDTQKHCLQQYYDTNKLLVDCLNSGCNVSPKVRQEIEDTLLLPMSE